MLRIFNEFKEAMKYTANKKKEDKKNRNEKNTNRNMGTEKPCGFSQLKKFIKRPHQQSKSC